MTAKDYSFRFFAALCDFKKGSVSDTVRRRSRWEIPPNACACPCRLSYTVLSYRDNAHTLAAGQTLLSVRNTADRATTPTSPPCSSPSVYIHCCFPLKQPRRSPFRGNAYHRTRRNTRRARGNLIRASMNGSNAGRVYPARQNPGCGAHHSTEILHSGDCASSHSRRNFCVSMRPMTFCFVFGFWFVLFVYRIYFFFFYKQIIETAFFFYYVFFWSFAAAAAANPKPFIKYIFFRPLDGFSSAAILIYFCKHKNNKIAIFFYF